MATTSHGAIVRESFEKAWSRGDFDGLDQLLAGTIDFHYRRTARTMDVNDLERTVSAWRSAFPDLRFSVEQLIEEGNLVAARVTHSGTQHGPMRGLPPTGRGMEVDDEYAMWAQLGLSP